MTNQHGWYHAIIDWFASQDLYLIAGNAHHPFDTHES